MIWPGFHVSDVYAHAGAKGIQSNSGGGQGGSTLGHCTNNAGCTDVKTVRFIYSDWELWCTTSVSTDLTVGGLHFFF